MRIKEGYSHETTGGLLVGLKRLPSAAQSQRDQLKQHTLLLLLLEQPSIQDWTTLKLKRQLQLSRTIIQLRAPVNFPKTTSSFKCNSNRGLDNADTPQVSAQTLPTARTANLSMIRCSKVLKV